MISVGPLVPLGIILKIFKKVSGNFDIIAENFENCFITFWEIFRKILRIIAENFENHFKIFEKNFVDFGKYFGRFRKVFRKILTIKSSVKFRLTNKFWSVSRNSIKIFEYYFENFQKKFWNILRIVMENIEKYFENSEKYIGKFRKSWQKISEYFEKYFGNLREVLQTISKNTF